MRDDAEAFDRGVALNAALHRLVAPGAKPCEHGCTHVVDGQWTALGLAAVASRAAHGEIPAHGEISVDADDLHDEMSEARAELRRATDALKLASAAWLRAIERAQALTAIAHEIAAVSTGD